MGGEPDESSAKRRTVVDVFGLKLEVSNPRLAELLTMDAKEALTTDIRGLASRGSGERLRPEEIAQATPDVILTETSPHDEEITRARRAFRERAAAAGKALGFETYADGQWVSPTGLRILMRTVERPVSLAAAAHFVGEMELLQQKREDAAECSVLFVVSDQQTADVFTVAIRQRALHGIMRTATIESLEELHAIMPGNHLVHRHATALLVPAANIDAGEMVDLLRAHSASPDRSSESL